MPSNRIGRINEELLRELSYLLPTLKDPRLQGGMVSVVRVDATPDLRYAKVFVSVLGSDQQRRDARKALRSAAGFLRRELGRKVQLRYTPELQFELDSSMENGARILSLLRGVESETEAAHAPADDQ